jgi:hypothetical protein
MIERQYNRLEGGKETPVFYEQICTTFPDIKPLLVAIMINNFG